MAVTYTCDVCGCVVSEGEPHILSPLARIDIPKGYNKDDRFFPGIHYLVCNECADKIAKAEYAGAIREIAVLRRKGAKNG